MRVQLIGLDYPGCEEDLSPESLPVVIGHDRDAGICLNDHSISNRHSQIDLVDGNLMVRDLGSVHGTFVNGVRVVQSLLRPGDVLALGLLTFLVQNGDEDRSSPNLPVADATATARHSLVTI